MAYILKQFDTPLVKFTVTENTSAPEISILWVDETRRDLLPLDLELTSEATARFRRIEHMSTSSWQSAA